MERRAYIHPTASVHPLAELGVGTVVHAGAVIGSQVLVGKNCVIGPNACLGQPGFGYSQYDGKWYPKVHPFRVVVGDNVDIGACACVDLGSWRETLIGDGTKIDNLVHVAHNVQIGEDCLLVAHCGLAGSVTLERNVWVGFGAHVNQRLTLCEGAFIGTGAVVTKDCLPNTVYAGVPAKSIRERTPEDA